jgi:hypothetical protein
MAGSLAHARPLVLLDEAVRLLRAASPATWIRHLIGSLPFAFSLLAAWSIVTDPHTSGAVWALAAFLSTLLFIWMNCWRAVYADRLLQQVSGRPAPLRVVRLIALQCYFGALKLLVLPLAALVVFSYAETVAFFRYLSVLSLRPDLSPSQMIARARQLAGRNRAQAWAILPILLFLQLAVALNLAIMLAMLPQIFRMLTGYESAFSRSGMHFMSNPVFPVLVLTVSWIAFDPFVQAVYTVRYFQAESMETAEDLRIGLRRISPLADARGSDPKQSRDVPNPSRDRKGADLAAKESGPSVRATILLVLLASLPAPLRAAVSPTNLRQSLEQAAQAPEYDWRLPAPAAASDSWLVRLTDRLLSISRSVGQTISDGLGRFFRWLIDRLSNSMSSTTPGGPAAGGIHGVMYLLIALVLAGIAFIVWQKRRALRAHRPVIAAADPIRLDAEELTAGLLPEESWLALAERSVAEQNFRFALRALYLASLAWLGRQQFLTLHSGKTNHEYEIEMARRSRTWPEARTMFTANVAAFERAWYGEHEVTAQDIAEFRERMGGLKKLLSIPLGVAA